MSFDSPPDFYTPPARWSWGRPKGWWNPQAGLLKAKSKIFLSLMHPRWPRKTTRGGKMSGDLGLKSSFVLSQLTLRLSDLDFEDTHDYAYNCSFQLWKRGERNENAKKQIEGQQNKSSRARRPSTLSVVCSIYLSIQDWVWFFLSPKRCLFAKLAFNARPEALHDKMVFNFKPKLRCEQSNLDCM